MTLNMQRLCFRSWWMGLDGRLACSISWERLRGLVWSIGLLPAWCRVRGSYNCRNTWPIYSLAFLQTSRHSGGLQCAARPCLTAPLSGTHWDSLNRWVHLCFDFWERHNSEISLLTTVSSRSTVHRESALVHTAGADTQRCDWSCLTETTANYTEGLVPTNPAVTLGNHAKQYVNINV